ncbi:MAG TPA: hypothetical protein VNS60_06060 [Solirubrobacterales bacterium]|nr:hypothetical protein [Solirubrobacterales bacterium]
MRQKGSEIVGFPWILRSKDLRGAHSYWSDVRLRGRIQVLAEFSQLLIGAGASPLSRVIQRISSVASCSKAKLVEYQINFSSIEVLSTGHALRDFFDAVDPFARFHGCEVLPEWI